MKRLITSIFLLLVLASCGPTIYKAQDFDNRTANHKTVAILPAEVSIQLRPNEMKNTSAEQLKNLEKNTGETIQDKMYSWFLKRSDKKDFPSQFASATSKNSFLARRRADGKCH